SRSSNKSRPREVERSSRRSSSTGRAPNPGLWFPPTSRAPADNAATPGPNPLYRAASTIDRRATPALRPRPDRDLLSAAAHGRSLQAAVAPLRIWCCRGFAPPPAPATECRQGGTRPSALLQAEV